MRRIILITTAMTLACKPDASLSPTDQTLAPAEDPGVPQEPDPPAIQQGARMVAAGHYLEAIDLLTPLYDDLKAREQYRASGLAASWLAVAHAQQGVFENASEPTQHAQTTAKRTQDPDVIATARMARGAYLLASEDFDAAVAAFETAVTSAPDTRAGTISHVLLGEALINRAFGRSHDGRLERPQDLDAARSAYTAAAVTAAASDDPKVLTGRVEEGLAVVAKFKGEKDVACSHAYAAKRSYEGSQAAAFLVQGPDAFVVDEQCEPEAERP